MGVDHHRGHGDDPVVQRGRVRCLSRTRVLRERPRYRPHAAPTHQGVHRRHEPIGPGRAVHVQRGRRFRRFVGIVRDGQEHAGQPTRGAAAHAREEHVRQPPDVHAVLHREPLETFAYVERVSFGVGE